MFGPWKKTTKPTYPTDCTWSMLQGENDGSPMLVRRNDGGKQLAAHPDYRYRIGIAFPLRAPDEYGFPGEREAADLDAIEDTLQERLEDGQRSLQVLGISTGGMRELVFYTRDPRYAEEVIASVRASVRTHEVQSYVEEDPEWRLFSDFS